jgi:hypothetical protein
MSYSQNGRAFGGRVKAQNCNPSLDEDQSLRMVACTLTQNDCLHNNRSA